MGKYLFVIASAFCVSGCVQTKYGHSVYFKNKCSFDVNVYAFRYSNYFKDEKAVVPPGEIGFVLSYVATKPEMSQVIPDQYYLDVGGNGMAMRFGKSDLISRAVPYKKDGPGFWIFEFDDFCRKK